MNAKPSNGIPTAPSVDKRTTNDTPGTPAIPLEVTINVKTKITCSDNDKSIPYICAMNNAAIAWYSVEPSKLNE